MLWVPVAGLVGVLSLLLLLVGLAQLQWLGRAQLGRLGEAGVVFAALALGAMAAGNGIELYVVTTRGTESAVVHTIFLIGFFALIVASVLVGPGLFGSAGAAALGGLVCSSCWPYLSESCS